MTTTEDIRQAIDANANDSRATYWTACSVLASSDANAKQREAALKKLTKAAQDIGADADQVDDDLQLLRERDALPDAASQQRDVANEVRQLVDEAASLESEAGAAKARSEELTKQAQAKRSSASASRNAVNQANQRQRAIRQKLAQRGCTDALIEVQVERQQQQLRNAQSAVEKAERELAESVAQHEQAKADPKRHRDGSTHDPIAAHVERRQRDVEQARSKLRQL